VTEQVAAEVFSLPVHPQLTDADLSRVIEVVNDL
jgi:dTDP-4-amino-4,6-dideoxygalactose transaminase